MKKIFLTGLLVFLTASSCSSSEEIVTSTASDQAGLSVTVYNSDLALVKELRRLTLPAGKGQLQFMDVASSILPVTVRAESLSNPEGFNVLEQNYEYDLMSQDKILDKYVGKTVKIVDWNQYQDRQTTTEATLLSNEGQIYKVGEEIYLGYPGYKVVPEIPGNLLSKPTLVWLYENSAKDPQEIEVSYLTTGLGWKADYVIVLDENEKMADLSGWVTLDNRSGTSYKDASLKLVAGEVHRAQAGGGEMFPKAMMFASRAVDAGSFQEKTFFEYHLYDLKRKTTIKNNQTKQISLLESSGVVLRKKYRVHGFENSYIQRFWEPVAKQAVQVIFEFSNSKENHLGMPLPEGVMRIYKKDDDQSQQFIGEDSVKHTPEDEILKLNVGEAFDVVAERVQTDYQQATSKAHESEWEVTIRNHKDQDIVVEVVEPLTADWKVLSKSHEFKKLDAFHIQFEVPVSKKGETKLKYRVRIEYP